jgi:hypothetical protein
METDAEINAAINEAMTIAGCHEVAPKTHFTIYWNAGETFTSNDYLTGYGSQYNARIDLIFPTIGSTTTTAVGHGYMSAFSKHTVGRTDFCIYSTNGLGLPFTFDVSSGKFAGKLLLVFSNPRPDGAIPTLESATDPSLCNQSDPSHSVHAFDLGCDKVTIDLTLGKYVSGIDGSGARSCLAYISDSK